MSTLLTSTFQNNIRSGVNDPSFPSYGLKSEYREYSLNFELQRAITSVFVDWFSRPIQRYPLNMIGILFLHVRICDWDLCFLAVRSMIHVSKHFLMNDQSFFLSGRTVLFIPDNYIMIYLLRSPVAHLSNPAVFSTWMWIISDCFWMVSYFDCQNLPYKWYSIHHIILLQFELLFDNLKNYFNTNIQVKRIISKVICFVEIQIYWNCSICKHWIQSICWLCKVKLNF